MEVSVAGEDEYAVGFFRAVRIGNAARGVCVVGRGASNRNTSVVGIG